MVLTVEFKLSLLEPGGAELGVAQRPAMTQNHGFFHDAVITTRVEQAASAPAATLAATDDRALSAEFKVTIEAPARGERLLACGEVIGLGRPSPWRAATSSRPPREASGDARGRSSPSSPARPARDRTAPKEPWTARPRGVSWR